MDKKEIKKRKRKRNRLIKSLVLVVAFVVAIGATFGATMAYFGGKSDTAKYNMQLKMGLYVGVPTAAANSATAYVVPSQIVKANCEFTVKSAKPLGTGSNPTDPGAAVSDATASDGLIRAKIVFSGIDAGALGSGDGEAYFPVKLSGGDTAVAHFVKYATDNYYYLVTGTSATDASEMYVVKSSTGEKKFTFDLVVSIPNNLTNKDAGKKITLTVTYEVVQADFYDSSSKLAANVKNAAEVFNAVKDNDAGYGY